MNVEEYNRQVAAGMSEAKLQQLVVGLAVTLGWTAYHTHDSRRSQAGFPDVCAFRGRRVVWAELKSQKGRLRPEQGVWLEGLRDAGQEVHVWRPLDLLGGVVEATLR